MHGGEPGRMQRQRRDPRHAAAAAGSSVTSTSISSTGVAAATANHRFDTSGSSEALPCGDTAASGASGVPGNTARGVTRPAYCRAPP